MIIRQVQKNRITNQNKQGGHSISSHQGQPKRLHAHELKHLLNLRIRKQTSLAIKNRLLEVIRIIHEVEAQIPTEA